MNRNGLYTAVKTDDGVAAIYIEEELLELGRLNRKVEQRGSENDRRTADAARIQKEKKRELAKAAKRWEKATIRLIRQEIMALVVAAFVSLALEAGQVTAEFAIPVLSISVALVCFLAGRYFGKYPVRRIKK